MSTQFYPLTIGQRTIAYSLRLFPGTPLNSIGGLLLLEDELDFGLMDEAIKLCVRRNDALRLRLVERKKARMPSRVLFKDIIEQYIMEDPPVKVGFLDYSDKTMEELDAALLELNSKAIDPFNEPMYQFTMVKAGDGRQGVFTKIDHMATDAWMAMMSAKEVVDLYYALKNGEEPPPAPHSFLNTVEAENAYLQSAQAQADREYWRSRFTTKPHRSFLMGGKKYPKSKTGKSARYEVRLDHDMCKVINAFCKEKEVSPPVLFNQIVGIYLSRASDSPDVSLANTAMLRSTLKEKRTCGPLINSQLVRMRVDENKTFLELLKESNAVHMSSLRHIRYPMLHVLMEVYRKYWMSTLFDTLLSFQVARIQIKENVRFETKWYSSGYFSNPFMMNITDMDNTGAYFLQYEYQTDPFSAKQIEDIHQSFIGLLEKGLYAPDTTVHNL